MGLAFSTRSEFFTSHLVARNVTHVYAQLHGKAPSTPPDLGPGFTLAVHAVFDGTHAWGARFAKISDVVRGHAKVVPYIGGDPLPRPTREEGCAEGTCSMRRALGIPANATLFCSYGGGVTFNTKSAPLPWPLLSDPRLPSPLPISSASSLLQAPSRTLPGLPPRTISHRKRKQVMARNC